MKIAVVIPAFNAARYLGEALESVLTQTVLPSEVVVVDDGSSDDTAAVAARFAPRVRCVRQRNAGVSAARNRGVRETTAPWLAFLDADDLWLPAKLARQSEALMAGGAVCFTALRVFHESSTLTTDEGLAGIDGSLEALLFHRGAIPPGTSSTMLLSRAMFERAGGYDPGLSTGADWDLLIRMRLLSEFTYVPEPLVMYRRHATNMSRSAPVLEHDSTKLLAKAFSSPSMPAPTRASRNRCLAWNDLVLAGSYFEAGVWRRAVTLALRALRQDPRLAYRVAGAPARRLRRRLGGERLLDA